MYIIYFILYIINTYQLVYHMMTLLQVETFWLGHFLTLTCTSGRGAFAPKNKVVNAFLEARASLESGPSVTQSLTH